MTDWVDEFLSQPTPSADAPAPRDGAFGSYDAADRHQKFVNWAPAVRHADGDLLPVKKILDDRSIDMARNDGLVAGGVTLHKDHIVGARFMLAAKPATRLVRGGDDEVWEREFQEEVETLFSLWADSPPCWPDAGGRNTLTDLTRLAVGSMSSTGEILAVSEWLSDYGRPMQTATMILDPARLKSPADKLGNSELRAGVERDRRGAPIAYHILDRPPGGFSSGNGFAESRRVMARKPSGRIQVFHAFEQLRPDQSRGVAAMVTALSEMRMWKQFSHIELERAAMAAMYATTLETDAPPDVVYQLLGAEAKNPLITATADHLDIMTNYMDGSKNLHVNGVKVPALPLGTSLKIQGTQTESPVGSELEASFLRRIAASFGLTYEQFSRDLSRTNYSSIRAGLGESLLHMQALKRRSGARFATYVYQLWFEEAVARGLLTTVTQSVDELRHGMLFEALTACDWIGSALAQVDPLKETQAAMLRIRGGLSSYEIESRVLGTDWASNAKQRAREHETFKKLGIVSAYDTEPTDAENAATGEPREETVE